MPFELKTFFDKVRKPLFAGSLTEQQVKGMEHKLRVWDELYGGEDLRWCANALAQGYHETGGKMWPIEEIGRGKGKKYGVPDPVTGGIYYGRGDIQQTWADNYKRVDKELGLTEGQSTYRNPHNMLDPDISARAMYIGMVEGWYTGKKLPDYFNGTRNDIFNARDIVNGDKNLIPKWSGGKKIGTLIEGYHKHFLAALEASYRPLEVVPPAPAPDEPEPVVKVTRVPMELIIRSAGRVVSVEVKIEQTTFVLEEE